MSRFHEFTVIHHVDGEDRVLGQLTNDFRSIRSLDPFVSSLLQRGINAGTVRLVDPASGKVIFERQLAPEKGNRPETAY